MLEIWPVTLIGALHTDLAYLSACRDSRCPLRCAPVPATNDTFRSFSYAFYLCVCMSVWERVSWEIIEWRFSIFPYPNNSNYLMHIYNRLVANSVAFPFSFSISIWISSLPPFSVLPFAPPNCLWSPPVSWRWRFVADLHAKWIIYAFPSSFSAFFMSSLGGEVKYLRLILNLCRVAIKSRFSRAFSLNSLLSTLTFRHSSSVCGWLGENDSLQY